MSKGFASNYRIVLLASGLFFCLGALGVRLVWLHVIDREALLKTISETRQQLIVEHGKRGDIRDERGAILATSHSSIVLGVDPHALIPGEWVKWPRFARLTGIPLEQLRQDFIPRYAAPPRDPAAAGLKLNLPGLAPAPPAAARDADDHGASDDTAGRDAKPDLRGRPKIRWVKLLDEISEEQFAIIRKLNLAGIRGERVFRRSYPNNELAAHIIGYVNKQQEPVDGIEAYADFYLRGRDGWRVGERDGRNRELAQFNTRKVAPADGYAVSLTINSIVQDIVEQELAYIALKFKPLKASIIVSRPSDGLILGMANYPTFNPNEYNLVPADEMARLKNVAVTDVYEPGSVFKIVAASAALEERLVTPQDTFDCTRQSIEYRGRVRSLPSEAHHFSRETSVAQIVALSSNRGAAQLAMLLGEQRYYRYAHAFGFGERLGFPVGPEASGNLAKPEKWDGLTITRMPMGHSVDCTVLQMHQAMSAIANHGVLMRPQIIRSIRDAAGDAVVRFGPVEAGRVISEPTARTMARLLQAVASKEGTAPGAAIPGFDVAGKTGTTQKLVEVPGPDGKPKLVYTNKHHVASFVGFFPAGRPQVAISVIVDDADAATPGGTAAGASVAAPSFKRLGERLIPVLDIQSYSQPAASPSLVAANQGGRP